MFLVSNKIDGLCRRLHPCWCGLGHTPQLDALGANPEPLGRAVNNCTDPLQIGIKTPLLPIFRMAYAVAYHRRLAAKLALGSHILPPDPSRI